MAEWRRAKQPEQKAARRTTIIEAAARLLDDRDARSISASAIADEAGVSKGSIYSYFSTKEEVFLGLLHKHLESWSLELDNTLGSLAGSNDLAVVSAAIVDTLRERETMTRLLMRSFVDLERNLSQQAADTFRNSVLPLIMSNGRQLELAVPGLEAGEGARLILQLKILVAGIWPIANPSGAMKEVTAASNMGLFRLDFYDELQRMFHAQLWATVSAHHGNARP